MIHSFCKPPVPLWFEVAQGMFCRSHSQISCSKVIYRQELGEAATCPPCENKHACVLNILLCETLFPCGLCFLTVCTSAPFCSWACGYAMPIVCICSKSICACGCVSPSASLIPCVSDTNSDVYVLLCGFANVSLLAGAWLCVGLGSWISLC